MRDLPLQLRQLCSLANFGVSRFKCVVVFGHRENASCKARQRPRCRVCSQYNGDWLEARALMAKEQSFNATCRANTTGVRTTSRRGLNCREPRSEWARPAPLVLPAISGRTLWGPYASRSPDAIQSATMNLPSPLRSLRAWSNHIHLEGRSYL